MNDVFKLENIDSTKGIDKFEIIIINRWGRKVYESKITEFTWDGSGFADGVYYWVINATSKYGDKLKRNGVVTIVR